MTTVLFDVDNVLADTDVTVKRYCEDIFEISPVHSWHSDANSMQMNDAIAMVKYQPNFWRHLPMIRSGFTLLYEMKSLGYNIQLVSGIPTKIGVDILNQKLDWIRYNLNPKIRVHFTNDRSVIRADVLVDDSPEFATAWKEKNPKGIVLMPHCEHNADMVLNGREWLLGYSRHITKVGLKHTAQWVKDNIAM